MTDSAQVLVFDSGVGALSIIAEIKQQIPLCSITYASDNAYFPYGDKDEASLIERVDRVLKCLETKVRPDIIVVACNTASTVALPKIRDHFKIPTVGVVPAIRPAAQQSKTKVIGLLATPGTVARAYTRELIDKFASDCTVIGVGSSELVRQAERKLRGQAMDYAVFDQVLTKIFGAERGAEVDTVVLACTHFPLLKDELVAASPRRVDWIDSGAAIARRVSYWIDENRLSLTDAPRYRGIFTAPLAECEHFSQTLNKLLPGPIETITVPTAAPNRRP